MRPLLLIGIIFLLGCDDTQQEQTIKQADSTQTLEHIETTDWQTEDDKYGDEFLAAWRLFVKDQPAKLLNGYVMAGSDSVAFPFQPELRQKLLFSATDSAQNLELMLQREVLGEVNFHFIVKENGRVSFEKEGMAVLQPGFWLAAEIETDEKTNEIIPCNEFYFETDSCTVHIKIEDVGIGKTARVKVICSLMDETKSQTGSTYESPWLQLKP